MKIVMELSESQSAKINSLVESKKYETSYQFMRHAIDTLLEIEASEIDVSPKSEKIKSSPLSNEEQNESIIKRQCPDSVRLYKVKIKTSEPNTQDELWPDRNQRQPWIWGQINSVFAIKFCVRTLANVLESRRASFIPLDLFNEGIEGITEHTRRYLDNLDEIYKREKDAKYSRSFPSWKGTPPEVERSIDRFMTQYLGKVRQNGWVDGAVSLLGFVNLSPKDLTISLTSYGLDFALAKNPIFDEEIGKEPKDVLSSEEIEIYLKAVREFSLAERNSLSTVGRLILEGHDEPQKLDRALANEMRDWTTAQVTTYRVGAIARMSDLKILSKVKTREDRGKWGVKYQIVKKAFEKVNPREAALA